MWGGSSSSLLTPSDYIRHDKNVKIWKNCLFRRRELSGHKKSIRVLAWSAFARRLASASSDHTAKVYNVDVTKEIQNITEVELKGHTDTVEQLAWHPKDESQSKETQTDRQTDIDTQTDINAAFHSGTHTNMDRKEKKKFKGHSCIQLNISHRSRYDEVKRQISHIHMVV